MPPFIYGHQGREVKQICCLDCKQMVNDWEANSDQNRCPECFVKHVHATACCRCHRLAGPDAVAYADGRKICREGCITTGLEFFCKDCEEWTICDEYDKRYNSCEECVEGYYGACIECGERTAHDDMVCSKGCPVGRCPECVKKQQQEEGTESEQVAEKL